ncbi:unnamed protein product [Soboliphyme baturini]|uniref:Transposase n=1 Tax=Soboliphyme baturini TaxID=241478 RepID=A0A183J8T8_9BILA|nr:unnamed protein product [Soboliphyme baturini]
MLVVRVQCRLCGNGDRVVRLTELSGVEVDLAGYSLTWVNLRWSTSRRKRDVEVEHSQSTSRQQGPK